MITSRDRRYLIDQAIEAVREALWDGRDKHPEDWRTVSVDEHYKHAVVHLEGIWNPGNSHEELAHLICRAAMIRAKLKLEESRDEQKD